MVSKENNNRQSCVDLHASVHTGVMVSLSVDWRKHCKKVLKRHVFRKHPYFLPNISITRNTLKSFKNAKVVIQLYFHTSSSSIFMKFDTHKH